MVVLPPRFSEIPRVQLLFDRPSDVDKLDRLTSHLASSGAEFWIKREDCNSGLAFGGNKVRKLEYVLADALDQGADALVTTGGVQSNHQRQTAAAAAKLGLKVFLHPRDAVVSETHEYHSLGNIQLNEILGAETFPVGTTEDTVLEDLRARGLKPYAIPSGASTHPLGGLGYARWAFELLEQEEKLGITFDTIVVAVGSCSTLAGIVAGFKLAQKTGRMAKPKRLLGFSVGLPDADELVLRIAKDTASKIGLDPEDITADDFKVDYGFMGPGYGHVDDRTSDAVKELARLEGILTEPVYTGKALAGMLHHARQGDFRDSRVLFCHTGGQSSLSAYPQMR